MARGRKSVEDVGAKDELIVQYEVEAAVDADLYPAGPGAGAGPRGSGPETLQ